MQNFKTTFFFFFFFIFLFINSFSQNVSLAIKGTTEFRGSGESLKNILSGIQYRNTIYYTFHVNGDIDFENTRLKLSKIKEYKDDLGNKIKLNKKLIKLESEYLKPEFFSFKLPAPERKAKSISTIKGTLKMVDFKDTKIIIPFKEINQKTIYSNKKLGIKVSLMDSLEVKEEIDKKMKLYKKASNDKIDKIKSNPKFKYYLSELSMSDVYLKGFFTGPLQRDNISLKIENKKEKLISIDLVDENGEELRSFGSSKSKDLYSFYIKKSKQKDCFIRIITETKSSVKEIPFKITNIPLP